MNWKFWQSQDSSNDKPPKPEAEQRAENREWAVYNAAIHYRNGDAETFECYRKRQKSDVVKFLTDFQYRVSRVTDGNSITTSKRHRTENYETLSREPVLEEIRTEEYRVSYTVDYEWTNNGWRHKPYKWREVIQPDSLEAVQIR